MLFNCNHGLGNNFMKKIKAIIPLAAAVQFIYLFWFLHYYRNPFRDEAYIHLLLGISAVAIVSTLRWLDTYRGQTRFSFISLIRGMTPLAAAYIIIIVCFLSIAAAYTTQDPETVVEGFSKTAVRLFSFGGFYLLLTAVLLVFTFPFIAAVVIQLWELVLASRKRIKGSSLILTVIIPVLSYLVLFPIFYTLVIIIFMDPDSGPKPSWVDVLPYFSPITWLEFPSLIVWFYPFAILLVGWSFLNVFIIRKHLKDVEWIELGNS